MARFIGRGVGKTSGAGKELRSGTEKTMLLVFIASLLYFHWTVSSRRGALERGMKYSSTAAESTGQREKAGEQRKRSIHLPWGDWMRDTGEEERKESEKIKDRKMIILEEAINNSYSLYSFKWMHLNQEKMRYNLSSLNNSTCYTKLLQKKDQKILMLWEMPHAYTLIIYCSKLKITSTHALISAKHAKPRHLTRQMRALLILSKQKNLTTTKKPPFPL